MLFLLKSTFVLPKKRFAAWTEMFDIFKRREAKRQATGAEPRKKRKKPENIQRLHIFESLP